ncbi:MAG: MoaD/ThiS family protein [Candidatus Marinimicrobia bacterium]|nr:MoaD/ThiS family protein [Candidatus Neomarinimicrobiota bacterium]MDP6790164.1 MoaD/ThiS family protein [Candidatus Neomarinimicrobiota bacterium]MDP7072089.1 MoaD/ThiS family protein [Candidatus Neomarinimicrobiota bacterium]
MSDTITIRVKCFSHVKQALKKDELALSIPKGSSTDVVINAVLDMAGGKLNAIKMRVAVNHSYEPEPIMLKEGDEVALIPPVQGG